MLLVGYLVAFAGTVGGDELPAVVADGVFVLFALLFTLLGLRVSVDRRQAGRTRLAWRFITAGFACQLIGHSSWFVENVVLHRLTYPAFAEYWFLGFMPLMIAGLLLLPGADRTRRDMVKLALDSLIVGAGTFMVVWYLVLSPMFAGTGFS